MKKMIDKIDNTQKQNLLLSLSVFKKLYDEKKDIYEIIISFIKCELANPSFNVFSLIEITQRINEGYNFNIPQAIVKTSLNRIKKDGGLNLDQGKYTNRTKFENIKIIDDDSNLARNLAREEEKYIVGVFRDNIAKKTLSDDSIKESLEAYILNKNDTHNIFTEINSCIIKNKSNNQFINGLNEIKQGLILYEGISYGIESINPNNWNKKIIFLDTEILFHLASYNGKLFKKITDDFIALINIVNRTKKIVTINFSEDVKKEIDALFHVAELVINKKIEYKPTEVVNYILDNCNSASDVISKKSDFYSFLSKIGITEYDNKLDYGNEKIFKYNLEKDNPDLDEKTQQHRKQLSTINILRRGNEYNTLDKVEYLLLTETRNTIELSIQYKKNRDVKDFPLALSLFDLTNQLWIKVNKGLGNSELPSTFDIRNKAKIALSSSLAKKVSEEFDKVSNDYKGEKIDKNSFIEKISDLRKIDSNPDNIDESNYEKISDLILDPDSMERHYGEKAIYKQESADKSNTIREQDYRLKEKDDEISKLKTQEEERIKLEKKKEQKSKIIKKRSIKGILYGIGVFLLFYFSDYLRPFIGDLIYLMEGLALIFTIFSFFGIDWLKIKSRCKKQ